MSQPPPPSESAGLDMLTEAAAPLKPLLNPLQSQESAPVSTTVEPPHSPNPQNPATTANGTNSDIAPAPLSESSTPAPVTNGVAEEVIAAAPAPVAAVAALSEGPSQSPLPVDATVPPTPQAAW